MSFVRWLRVCALAPLILPLMVASAIWPPKIPPID